MLKKIGIFSLLSCVSMMSLANVETLKSNLNKNYPDIQVTNIQATEMTGLYSANLDNQIIYLDENAEHMFIGSMVRLKDQKNLTKDLVLKQNSIDWQKLPLQDAIKTVKGNGKRQLAIFSDPNCPYCKQLEVELDKLNDVTIYTFIYALKPQSLAVSKQVWCDANPSYAWKNLLQKNVQPKAKTCANPIDRNLALGRKLGVNGTPTLIFSNGLKMVGGRSAEDIQMIWKELGL
ncbi:thioredoxin fold domain-containing protein [Acinetobacter haemolyticus]|uniref:Thiol:disulfide interchange protein n=1 Tax=Acinetobacter haemolyticus TaxID=29430 RepID=A0A1L6KRZ4_ACIHA|nr:DsbC family protein [Acinetobacter haemolyticus]APR71840.1 thiol:disulfide interchange protein [Acinetobacter haemolyticus]ATZ68696.1 thiol:disulfide interchange protein [Acinetobacter haemolyticus]NAR18932.1 thioredoxin fold domain-containing protein [Acinetobacter haemolyticus]NAR30125.1 thioredoxin fold domain-containing protein [Acinetobacter haemolyticus]NAR36763.1 thioredoxin fold domain-containing protein [Acinetobacter haemolyticus]